LTGLPFVLANDIGLVAFAISGVYKGINRKLDVLGASVLGFMTALGGGVIRDVLANKTPAVFTGYSDISFAFLGVVVSFLIHFLTKKDISNSTAVKISDAIGLAAFTVIGASIAANRGFNMIGILLLGVITGVGGGLISDLLTLKVPMVLSEDFYATCSVAGTICFYLSLEIHYGINFATYSSFLVVLLLRSAALIFKWSLPKFTKD